MAVRPQYLAYVLEQLEGLGNLRSRRMFSGVGLYSDELFFGLIHDDTLFFKTDATNSPEYIARNMPRFMPFPDRPKAVMAYYQVPADIVEDADSLTAWARKSVAVALSSHAAKSKPAARMPPARKKRVAKKIAKKKAKTSAKKNSSVRRRR